MFRVDIISLKDSWRMRGSRDQYGENRDLLQKCQLQQFSRYRLKTNKVLYFIQVCPVSSRYLENC